MSRNDCYYLREIVLVLVFGVSVVSNLTMCSYSFVLKKDFLYLKYCINSISI
jgi:hypothetical protein